MKYLPAPLALSLLLLVGCGQASDKSEVAPPPAQAEAAPAGATDGEAPTASVPQPGPQVGPTAGPRLRVYHATLRLKVADLPRAGARLDSLVRASGGYVSAATEARENGEWRQETTVRVAPGRYAPLLAALGRLGRVEQKTQTTDDVTAEHADVAARLATKRAVEQRYRALLGQSAKISDILAVEKQLGEVREEIESTESRLKALNDEVAYSTITASLYQPLAEAMPDAPVVSLGSRVVGLPPSGCCPVVVQGFRSTTGGGKPRTLHRLDFVVAQHQVQHRSPAPGPG